MHYDCITNARWFLLLSRCALCLESVHILVIHVQSMLLWHWASKETSYYFLRVICHQNQHPPHKNNDLLMQIILRPYIHWIGIWRRKQKKKNHGVLMAAARLPSVQVVNSRARRATQWPSQASQHSCELGKWFRGPSNRTSPVQCPISPYKYLAMFVRVSKEPMQNPCCTLAAYTSASRDLSRNILKGLRAGPALYVTSTAAHVHDGCCWRRPLSGRWNLPAPMMPPI